MKPSELIRFGAAVLLFSCSLLPSARAAGSATWNLNPPGGIWYDSGNWTPATVPNTISDTATFGVSNVTTLTSAPGGYLSSLGAFAFSPGASAYSISFARNLYPAMIGAGVMNDSGLLQSFIIPFSQEYRDQDENNNAIWLINSATAGTLTHWTVNGSSYGAYRPAELRFNDTASAGSATIDAGPGGPDIEDHDDGDGSGGTVNFRGSSTADHATINLNGGVAGAFYGSPPVASFADTATAASATITTTGGTIPLGYGGAADFSGSSTAGSAIITNQGGAVSEGRPGQTSFGDNATAGNAMLIANAGPSGASGGLVNFWGDSTGGTARCELFGNGTLDISLHAAPGVTIGSVEGDGLIVLGAQALTVGSNNLSTAFSGVIQDSESTRGGGLIKVGSGTLTLTGANTYTGRTRVRSGRLFIQDRIGSLLNIQGNVSIDGGTFGGSGRVGGSVTVGSNSGRPAVLESNLLHGANFIIQKSLRFNSGGIYRVDVNSHAERYSFTYAQGVTIEEGALFTMNDLGNSSFGPVTLPMIANTSDSPIVGMFANLPEGGSIVVGQNTFYATYHGGDGNDFYLTTVP